MFTRNFLRQALERAIKTAAQAALALIAVGGGILEVDWAQVGSVAGLAAVASVLTSAVGSGVGQPDSPSLVKVE